MQMAVRVQNYTECFRMFPESSESGHDEMLHENMVKFSRTAGTQDS